MLSVLRQRPQRGQHSSARQRLSANKRRNARTQPSCSSSHMHTFNAGFKYQHWLIEYRDLAEHRRLNCSATTPPLGMRFCTCVGHILMYAHAKFQVVNCTRS
ncbi:hypothetical protein K466DRAFT_87358 [Polyporus arcularius HHB13444]|uniref:Uncharacterized protein n=1 Tax=Polyporus arcularius HHB13444 TaxID=1314778 RepID=A0A5C3NKV7_9APHY|nr:hypothetical protein K466DRAFT_87358 [Polyporus arcularius HHB13444]